MNKVWGDDKDSVNFANSWMQIKYYKHNDNEIVGINMMYSPCTGLGCSVSYCLLYDLKHKVKNFFGTFRMDQEIKLYHFGRKLCYLGKTFGGDPQGGSEMKFTYELYALDDKGHFNVQRDARGNVFTIAYSTFPKSDSTKKEKLVDNWFEKIK